MKIEAIYWFLAYAGAIIHFMVKWMESRKPFMKFWNRSVYIPMIISAMAIPVILILLTEPFISGVLPLNKLTAFIAGYQTQSVLKSFVTIFNRNIPSNEANPTTTNSAAGNQLPNTEEN